MNETRKYYLLAFLEGVGVLTAEVLGAKMLAPFFGASLFIWTTVIGMTLLCLTVGYYLGSRMARDDVDENRLFLLFGSAAFFLGMMPLTTNLLFGLFANWNLFVAIGASTLFLLGPPLVALGATTPIMIQRMTHSVSESGKIAGNVYAISTIGGILTTFSMGFIVIPGFGISVPVVIVAVALVLLANFLLKPDKALIRWGLSASLLLPVLLVVLRTDPSTGAIKTIYESEGMLGQIKVVDVQEPGKDYKSRKLLLNGIPQTNVIKGDYEARSLFHYVHMLSTLSSMKPPGSNVLLCGLGGGSLVAEFEKLGFQTDVVDIDPRLMELGNRYFYLDETGLNFFIDDARHYIANTETRYDLVVMDLLFAETQPDHLYSRETFALIKEKLAPDGLLLVNFQGYFNGKKGRGARAIFATLRDAGYEVHAVSSGPDQFGDIIYVCSPGQVPFDALSERRINACCIELGHTDIFARDPRQFVISDPDLRDAVILRDDQPILDVLRLSTTLEFRRNKIDELASKELEDRQRLFK